MLNYQRVYGENMGKLQNEGKSWKMMLGQSTGWVETNPGCLLVWDYLRSPAKNYLFFAGYLRLAMVFKRYITLLNPYISRDIPIFHV
jgi:hypothetical protein